MTERESLPPVELEELAELRAKDKRTFSVNLDKKVIGIILVMLFGGGGYGGVQLVTKAELDERTATLKTEISDQQSELSTKVDNVSATVDLNSDTISSVRKVQIEDVAIRGARRVVDDEIQCRRNDDNCSDRKDMERERIRRRNVKRLESGDAPCSNLACM